MTGAVSLSSALVIAMVGVLAVAVAVVATIRAVGRLRGCGYLGCAMSERMLDCGGRRPGTPHGELDPAADGDDELVDGDRLVNARMELQ